MPLKRRGAARKAAKLKKAKTSKALKSPSSPAKPEPHLPDEMLLKIFNNCDEITAASFGLTCKKWYAQYKRTAKELFGEDLYPLPLNHSIKEPGQRKLTLRCVIQSYFPPHLTWDSLAIGKDGEVERGMFVGSLALQDRIKIIQKDAEAWKKNQRVIEMQEKRKRKEQRAEDQEVKKTLKNKRRRRRNKLRAQGQVVDYTSSEWEESADESSEFEDNGDDDDS